MGFRLFIIAAIVLIVFGIVAAAATSLELFSVSWFVWFMASFLSFLVDVAFGGPAYANGGFQRGQQQTPVV